MANAAQLFSLIIATALICSLAGYAVAVWKRDSASTPRRKSAAPPEETPTSDIRTALAQVQVDQAALFSTLEKLTTTVKRLSSRNGMRELRSERETTEAPPLGASKADLLRHYGMRGKVGPEFARAQQEMELRGSN